MIARLASLVVRLNLLVSPGSPGLNPQCCDITRPWAQECRALLPPHSSPFCQDEWPLPSSPANRQILKNLLCPLPFSLLSFSKARWETSCGHSWQTISDIALSQKPAAGQYRHIPLSSGSLTTLLWVEYFTKTPESLITLLQKPALSNQEHITQSTCLLTTLPQKPVLGNQEHTMSFNLLNHRSPYCSNLLWAIHNKNSLTQYSFCNHPAAEICSGQLPFTLHFYVFSLSTLLQKSVPGHWIKKPKSFYPPAPILHQHPAANLCSGPLIRKHWYSKAEEAANIYASTRKYNEGGHVPDACDNSGLIVDEQRMIHMPLKWAQMWRITFQCQSLEGQTAGDFPEIRSLYWFGCYSQQKIVVAVSPRHINLPTSHETMQVHGMPPGKTLFCGISNASM